MILIHSHSFDESTNDVIERLLLAGCDILRINEQDVVYLYSMTLDTVIFEVNSLKYTLQDFTTFWHRKESVNFQASITRFKTEAIEENLKSKLNHWLSSEILVLKTYWFEYFGSCLKYLGNYAKSTPNKLVVLSLAQQIGFQIPQTIVTSYKKEVVEFKIKFETIITKPLQDIFSAKSENYFYTSYTKEVTNEHLEMMEDVFFPSLFQEKIEKKYELRVFYLNGECYTMAIFSQMNINSEIDFRVHRQHIREVPFSLPQYMQDNIHTLMQQLQLNTASLDLLVTNNNQYVFLEVNPVGQFGMMSYPCNYYLEEKIANFLSHERANKH